MTFGSHLNPSEAAYYTNITGFIRGDISFHNITPSFLANSTQQHYPTVWKPFAERFMNGSNMTEAVEKSGTWNWTGSDKVALSVVEKSPVPSGENLNITEEIVVVHVRD